MSNSLLVNYIKLSPNCNQRTAPIKKITIHHAAGNSSVQTLGNIFTDPACEASANYGIDSEGLVGMYVQENNRAWTSSSFYNDNQSITIEIANDGGAPDWHVSDKALEKLVELCVDICKRNGIERLNYTGDANGNLTRHNMFAATVCPRPVFTR
jgi:N-acetyl-anhydromuramyl-L-alanine amidase AmpD